MTDDYARFLAAKRHSDNDFGFDAGELPSRLFDFQAHLVALALRKGRFAWLVDCGLGKGPMALVWAMMVAQHTNKPVLILTPLAVAFQLLAEAQRFGIDAARSFAGEIAAPVVICNYDRLHHFNPDDFSGVVCDEAACIKNFSGATTKQVTDFVRKVEYRLLATATAAPNDYIELGTFSQALGCLGYMDMLARFFKNDQNSIKPRTYRQGSQNVEKLDDAAKWKFKPHAEIPFWQWVCSWAIAARRPSDLGYSDDRFVLPPLIERDHVVDVKSLPNGMLFALPAVGLSEQRDERRRSITERCERVVDLVAPHPQSLIWCDLNDEGDLLAKLVPDSVQVSGKDSEESKEEAFIAFANGTLKRLICKRKIAGWGMNWQNCHHITEFPTHSYEQRYQGIRRCYRFGQTHAVEVDMVTTEGEKSVLKNLQRKGVQADRMFTALVSHMHEGQSLASQSTFNVMEELPQWLA
jgi:hypothetical protein